jgi:hypothetical protein
MSVAFYFDHNMQVAVVEMTVKSNLKQDRG